MTAYFAPEIFTSSALPAQWSLWAWLMRRILTWGRVKPSFSMLARIWVGDVVRLVLMRMCPWDVVMR